MKILNLFNKSASLTIGGQPFTPQPLDLESTLRLLFLIAPYLPFIEDVLSDFNRALVYTGGDRPRLLSAIMQAVADRMKPQDITAAFAILLHRTPEEMAVVKPVELIKVLPVLDDINDFAGLVTTAKELGLTVRYAK
jgi:hypothetical protein